jgi:hypothetical protein
MLLLRLFFAISRWKVVENMLEKLQWIDWLMLDPSYCFAWFWLILAYFQLPYLRFLIHLLSHSSILVRRNRLWNFGSTERRMERRQPLDPMGHTRIGRQSLALMKTRPSSSEPLFVKQPTLKGSIKARLPVIPSLRCSTKGNFPIRPPIQLQRCKKIDALKDFLE